MKTKNVLLVAGLSLGLGISAFAGISLAKGSNFQKSEAYNPATEGLIKVTSENCGNYVGRNVAIISDNNKFQLAWNGAAALISGGDYVEYTLGESTGNGKFSLYLGDKNHYLGDKGGFGFNKSTEQMFNFQSNNKIYKAAIDTGETYESACYFSWTANNQEVTAATFHYGTAPVLSMYGGGEFYLYVLPVKGSIYLDLYESQNEWESANAKFAVYFFDNNSHNGWSEFAVKTEPGSHVYTAAYNLDFVPTSMIGVRLKDTTVNPNWDDKWSQTSDLGFNNKVIGVKEWNESWTVPFATVKGLSDYPLNNYKRNGAGHPEHFAEVVLPAGTLFTIKFGDSESYSYGVGDGVDESEFTIVGEGENSQIKAVAGGTYEFYFDTDSYSLHIANPVKAAADEWAQAFLADGCTETKSNWEDAADDYAALSDGAKALIAGTEHVSHDVEVTDYVDRAVQRYDYVLERFGTADYNDFLGRVNSGLVVPHSLGQMNSLTEAGDNSALIIVSTVIALSALSLTVLLVIKKKRHN